MKQMKKIYNLLAAGLMTAATVNAQNMVKYFDSVSYIGAFPVTDNTTATDWTAGWANFNPENAVYATPTMTVNANITSNTTWTASNVYQLVGNIAVTNGATLTIEPGTVIRGDKTSKSCLIITKGSKIHAQGTASKPIVFTSNEEPSGNGRASGDWGGVILLGSGITNTAGGGACTGCSANPNINKIEGFAAYDAVQLYGGSDNADSSGVFTYVRIEFAGVALSGASNSEINGLTLGGVGSKTVMNHIQVSLSGDDAFEWFGGAVNCKYLIAYRTLDDDFDTDNGYAGNVQYGLIVRDPNMADQSKVESFESDNYDPGAGRTPITNAVFSNITVVGPTRDGTATPGSGLFLCGVQIRRNSAISIFNSIITGWPKGLQISGSATQDNFLTSNADSVAYFKNNWIIGASKAVDAQASTSPLSFYNGIFGAGNNDSTKTNTNVNWVNAFPASLTSTPDFRLNSGSAAASVAAFTNAKLLVMVPAPATTNTVDTTPPPTTGIETAGALNAEITLSPNPASEYITITGTTSSTFIKVEIRNITGSVIYSEEIKPSEKINISAFNSGLYFATVTTNSNTKTIKFIVAK